jgi:hypothetical protein
MNLLLPGYDEWRLHGPDEPHEVDTEDGALYNQHPEQCEEQPSGYSPKPCNGTMDNNKGYIICDTCGEAE